jgi:acetyl esterase/lipase
MGDGTTNVARSSTPTSFNEGGEKIPLLVMVYGGGWIMGGLEQEENCRAWVQEFGGVAVSLGFKWVSPYMVDRRMGVLIKHDRHAPKHPFPRIHEDIEDAVRWVSYFDTDRV